MFRNYDLKFKTFVFICILAVSLTGISYSQSSSDNKAMELLDCARANWVETAFYSVVSIQIYRPDYTQNYRLEVWSEEGGDPAFIRILAPEDEAGSGYLLKDEKLWYFKPAAGQAISLPQTTMTSEFLGSDLYLEDVYRGTLNENYDVQLLGTKTKKGDENEEIKISRLKLTPKPKAPVVFGKLEIDIRGSDCSVLTIHYFDQRDSLIREAEFSDFTRVDEKRVIPLKTEVTDLKREGRYTIEEIESYDFGIDIPPERFTLDCLVKGDEFCGSS